MSLVEKLKAGCANPSPQDYRQYVDLLSADSADARSVQALQSLMLRLHKHPEDVEADRATLRRVAELRGTIRRGTKLGDDTRKAEEAVKAHAAETRRIVAERERGLAELNAKTSALTNARAAAEAAIKELAELKLTNECLLADEPSVPLADLD